MPSRNRIRPEHIAQAQRLVSSFTFREKEQLADEIFETQPNLLASVLAVRGFGVADEDLDVLLNILFMCHEAVRASGIQMLQVSEAVQDICLARIVGRSKFLEGLSSKLSAEAVADQVNSHGEKYLLALVVGELQGHGLTQMRTEAEKYLLLSALNLAETIAYVATDL